MTSAQQPYGFFFVNKDATSPARSRSYGFEAAAIQRHVQSVQAKKGSKERLKLLQASSIATKKIAQEGFRLKPKVSAKGTPSPSAQETPSSENDEAELVSQEDSPGKLSSGFRSMEMLTQEQAESVQATSKSRKAQVEGEKDTSDRTCKSIQEQLEETPRVRGKRTVCSSRNLQRLSSSSLPSKAAGTATEGCDVVGDIIDPFDSSVIKISPIVMSIMRYHLSFPFMRVAVGKSHETEQLDKNHRYKPFAQEVLKGCLANELHLYALLAATAGRMTLFSGINVLEADRFMQKALQSMRKYLMGASVTMSADVILTVCYLSITERYRGNHTAALIHMQVLKKYVSTLDITLRFDRYVFDLVCVVDVLHAVQHGTPPVLPLEWQPGLLTRSRLAKMNLELDLALAKAQHQSATAPKDHVPAEKTFPPPLDAVNAKLAKYKCRLLDPRFDVEQRAGRGLMQAAYDGNFSCEMIRVISEIRLYLDYATFVTHEDALWIDRTVVALLAQLGSIFATGLEECCRLPLVIMLAYASTPLAWGTVKPSLFRLKDALAGILDQYTSNINQLRELILGRMLLWALMVGCFAAGPDEEEWFMIWACKIAGHIGVKTHVQLQQLMAQFLHFDTSRWSCLSRLVTILAE